MPDKEKQEVDKIDVGYVANLARLELTSDEINKFQNQLDEIVGYVKKVNELNLDGVEPTSHAVSVQNVFREDKVKPGLDHEKVMENAPANIKSQFKVPQIIE
ncbi:Asp-tRNA(Asn)/Glu-tRNA(Gln) amidotransferase subunit GatC [Verrucomicrobiota bacterium]